MGKKKDKKDKKDKKGKKGKGGKKGKKKKLEDCCNKPKKDRCKDCPKRG